jgi:hypothetical protein
VHKLDAGIDGGRTCDLFNSLKDRSLFHLYVCRTKEKVGAKPTLRRSGAISANKDSTESDLKMQEFQTTAA